MQLQCVKILLVSLIVGLAMSTSHAQLLQDRNKLKTERREGRGFSIFKKQAKSASGRSNVTKVGSPRYSKGESRGRFFRVTPRYSQSIAGAGGFRTVNPKFTKDIAGKGGFRGVNPRFSKSIAGQGGDRFVSPRFSKDPGNFGSYVARRPRSASGKGMVFTFPRIQYYIGRTKNRGEEDWIGPRSPGRTKKEGRNFHPSFAHTGAKYKTSGLLRDGMQKFNILWVRVNGNKSQPKGVYKKSKKLKYDKDETEIWNNKEREYSHN